MKAISKLFLGFTLLLLSSVLQAAPHYIAGKIKNITSSPGGLLVMLDSGVPDNCEGAPYNWMLIKQENTTMISVALAVWVSGKLEVQVYTNPIASGSCVINQFDPKG